MSPELRAQTIAEWNDLGFWYDRTPESGWVIRGARTGLEKFAALLEQYATASRNIKLSEHDHFGPYMYLKVVTWSSSEINQDGIYGTLQDLVRLANLVRERVGSCTPGDSFALAQAFSAASSTELTLVCESESFNPGAYDAQFYIQDA
jgi:hypothetical protein